jgi:hypothetical protein
MRKLERKLSSSEVRDTREVRNAGSGLPIIRVTDFQETGGPTTEFTAAVAGESPAECCSCWRPLRLLPGTPPGPALQRESVTPCAQNSSRERGTCHRAGGEPANYTYRDAESNRPGRIQGFRSQPVRSQFAELRPSGDQGRKSRGVSALAALIAAIAGLSNAARPRQAGISIAPISSSDVGTAYNGAIPAAGSTNS